MNTDNSMEIAVFTRGYERDFEWQSSFSDHLKLPNADNLVREELKNWFLKDQIKLDEPGVLISRNGDYFALMITGLQTNHRRPAGGLVIATFVFFNLSEKITKKVATVILKNWKEESSKLLPFILRGNEASNEKEWSIQTDLLKEYIKKTSDIELEEEVSQLNNYRRLRPYLYSRVRDPEFFELSKIGSILKKQKFSLGNGVKTAIGKPFSDNSQKILVAGADLVILPSLEQKDLPAKKKVPSSITPKKKSAQPSKHSSPSKTSPPFSKKSPAKKISMLLSRISSSTYGVIAAIGIIVILAIIARCDKEASSPSLAPAKEDVIISQSEPTQTDRLKIKDSPTLKNDASALPPKEIPKTYNIDKETDSKKVNQPKSSSEDSTALEESPGKTKVNNSAQPVQTSEKPVGPTSTNNE